MVYKKKIVLIIQLLNITNYLQALEYNSLIIKTAAAVAAIAVGGISLKLHQYLSFQADSKKLKANIAKVLDIESKDSFLEEFNLEKFDTKLIGSTKAKAQEESSRIDQDYLNISDIQAETKQYLQKWSNKLSSTKNRTAELKQAENLIRENEINDLIFAVGMYGAMSNGTIQRMRNLGFNNRSVHKKDVEKKDTIAIINSKLADSLKNIK